ncbi:unnamed protein product, partial [Urochloa humidicola]
DLSRDWAEWCLAQAAVDPGASAARVAEVAWLSSSPASAASSVAPLLGDIPSGSAPNCNPL